jgi:hypothetical protein
MKKLSPPADAGNAKVRALQAALASARTTVALLEAELADASGAANDGDDDPLLDHQKCLDAYGIGRDALKNAADSGKIELVRGARGKILVRRSEVERWLASRPYSPRPRKAEQPANLEAWEAKMSEVSK